MIESIKAGIVYATVDKMASQGLESLAELLGKQTHNPTVLTRSLAEVRTVTGIDANQIFPLAAEHGSYVVADGNPLTSPLRVDGYSNIRRAIESISKSV